MLYAFLHSCLIALVACSLTGPSRECPREASVEVGLRTRNEGRRPHIILIIADDLGWANVEWNVDQKSGSEIQTPNLLALKEKGLELERHYAFKQCGPSRASLLSGRLPAHVAIENTGLTSPDMGIPPGMTTIGTKMKQAGYTTTAIGKWDAGMATEAQTPRGRGFGAWLGFYGHSIDAFTKKASVHAVGEVDNCLGQSASTPFYDFSQENDSFRGPVKSCVGPTASEAPLCYAEALFADRAVETIMGLRNNETLFMLYASQLCHTPLNVPRNILEEVNATFTSVDNALRVRYTAMVKYLDNVVGRIESALVSKKMWNNTFLVFVSDNGGPIYVPASANNYPLKGGKYSDWEGGVRTVGLVSGGVLKPARRNQTFPHLISIADWYATLCALANTSSTDDAISATRLPRVDSIDQSAALLNGAEPPPRRELFLSPNAQLLSENGTLFKLVTGTQPFSTYTGPSYPNRTTQEQANLGDKTRMVTPDFKIFGKAVPFDDFAVAASDECTAGCLYNLNEDPTEHHNCAFEESQLADRMRAMLAQNNETIFHPQRRSGVFAACEFGFRAGGAPEGRPFGVYGPFIDAESYYLPRLPRSESISFARRVALQILSIDFVQRLIGEAVASRLATKPQIFANPGVDGFQVYNEFFQNMTLRGLAMAFFRLF